MKIRLEMKNYNMILIERLQKYQLYHQVKLISMNILLVKRYCHLIEDQGKKQIDALADLKPKEIKPRETKPNKYSNYFLDQLAEIRNSSKIDFNNLKYTFKDRNNAPIGFIEFKGPLHIFESIHDGDINLEDV